MTFIQEIANKIINDFGTDFKSTAIVMPGRRGGLFMKKALAKAVGKPILLPHIFSIEEYIYHQSEMRKMDETTMLAILYAVYKNHAGQNAFSIDDFLLTGKTILSDFNDVDDYLLDPEDVFTYLMRVREIENWFPGEATTNLQKNYLAFYQLLKPIYYSFTDKCKELGMGYQGLASRVLSQKNSFNDFTKIIFVGLNAITPSLQTHINKLIQKEQAALYWDADSWYFDNPNHEAGHFLRLNRTAWPGTFSKAPSLFENTNKKINIIGAPLGYAQIQTALHILQSQYGNSLEDTVLVLANEGLMIPLLSSLPPELAEKVNISGGYPLKNTLLGQLIASYLELTSETFTSESSAITYHFDKLVEFLSNPLLRLLIEEKDIESYDKIVEEISSGKFRFFYWNQEQNESSELLKQFDELLPELISPCEKWESILARLIDVTSRLFEKCADIDIEHEAAWTINSMLKALLNTLKSYGSNLDITYNSAAYFIRRLLQTAKIPLKGEPLKGVQILGVLETRSLDFKNVIIVGANEGFLPASGQGDSFLPNDVRYELKLPLQYERDAVYAYHFWRLIQRAEEISIIYNTESDPLFGKEPSRYISQIEHELLPAFPKIDFKRMTLGIDYEIYFENTVDIYNRELIDKQLNYIASKGLSFSRLYNFIKCPRLFLLEGIYNIEKWENENGNIAINTLGSVFHAAIEHVTLPYIGKLLVPEDFDKMISQIESGLEKGLEKYKVKHTNSGFNYLAKELLFDILKNWLINMKNSAPANYYVKATEYGIDSEIMIEGGRKIKIKGIADRVEYHNGTLRIMDFKTTHKRYDLKFDTSPKSDIKSPKSEIKSPESDIKSPESDIVGLLKNTKNRYLAQVLFYSWLYSLKENVSDISGGVYSVLSKAGHKPDLIHEKNSPVILSKEQLDKIGSGFIYFIEEIFSPEQTFRPTPSNDNCQYCSYKSILCDAQQLENMDDE